jgi:peptidoglycan/LPS O-acetylase OafA/YrhL
LPAVRKIVVKHDISYGIYLWGFFVQQTLYHFLGPVNIYVFMLYSLYIASLMGFISFLLVEKLFMRYGKIVEAKIRTRAAPLKPVAEFA